MWHGLLFVGLLWASLVIVYRRGFNAGVKVQRMVSDTLQDANDRLIEENEDFKRFFGILPSKRHLRIVKEGDGDHENDPT